MDSLMPNGGTLDYIADARYRGRTGVRKQSLEDAFYNSSSHFFLAPQGSDPDADLTTWHDLMAGGEPYDDAGGVPSTAVADMRDELTTHHSAYYIGHSQPPAPTIITSGWNDDLFPADEAIRFYNRTRTETPRLRSRWCWQAWDTSARRTGRLTGTSSPSGSGCGSSTT